MSEEGTENSAIRELREQIKALNTDLNKTKSELEKANETLKATSEERDTLNAEKQEAERAKMEEVERLKAEKADLEKLVGETESLRTFKQQMDESAEARYNTLLEGVPEDKRAEAQELTALGDWHQRASNLERVTKLFTPPETSQGTRTSPGTPGSQASQPTEGGEKPAETKAPPKSWSEAFPDIDKKLAGAQQPSAFS